MALRGAATVMPEAAEASAAAAIATPIQLRADPVVDRRVGTRVLGDVPRGVRNERGTPWPILKI